MKIAMISGGLIIFTAGAILVYIEASIWTVVGVFFMIWGNNMGERTKL